MAARNHSIRGRTLASSPSRCKKIEREEFEPGGVARIRHVLDHAERGDTVGADTTHFAVEISLFAPSDNTAAASVRIFMRPVEPGAGQQPDRAPVQPGVHALASHKAELERAWPRLNHWPVDTIPLDVSLHPSHTALLIRPRATNAPVEQLPRPSPVSPASAARMTSQLTAGLETCSALR
jgi:hypothetical protein